ncbi:MAG: ester cyclase [bacterium]
MNRTQIFIAIFIFAGIGFVLSASAQITAVRSMPYDEYWPSQRQQVTIELTGEPGPITVVETLPAGWTVGNILPRAGMSLNDGVITWDLLTFDGSGTLSYKAMPPEDAEGEAVFSGTIGIQPIGGITIQARATPKPLGIFDDHKDFLDELKLPNTAAYDPETGEYVLYGTGVWGRCAYTELSGDFTLKARGTGENPHATEPCGLFVFDTLTNVAYTGSGSAAYTINIHKDGYAKAFWNAGRGYNYSPWTPPNDGRYMITRRGDTFSMYYFDTSIQTWKLHHSIDMVFTDPVYVGIAAGSTAPQSYSTAYFTEVELIVSEEEIRGVVEQATPDAFNAHDLNQGLSYFATDAEYDFRPQPPPMVGTEEIEAFFDSMFDAFPDWHVTRNRVFVSGNMAVSESTVTGTQQGEWMGIPATGNSIEVPVLHVWEFAGNKAQWITEYVDMASVLIQLGVMDDPQWPPFELPFQHFDPPSTYLPPMDAAEELISRWNAHNLVMFYKSIRNDADIYMYPLGMPTDKDTFVASFQMYFDAFPDLYGDFVNLIDLSDGWVLGELLYTGTNTGEFLGNPPTNGYCELRGAILWRFDEEGMASNYYVYFDNITLLAQLGLYPPSETSVGDWDLY